MGDDPNVSFNLIEETHEDEDSSNNSDLNSEHESEEGCECNGSLLLDGHRNAYVGECLVKGGGRYFCYVDPASSCSDKGESNPNHGAFYSFIACNDMAHSYQFLPRNRQTRYRSALRKVKLDRRHKQRQRQG